MIHSIAYIAFILPFTAWLGYELQKSPNLRTYWKWIFGAALLGIVGSQIYHFNKDIVGNFILHASGGASATLLFVYLFKTLDLRFNWRLTAGMLFAFVCMVGVLNELAEYFFEFFGLGPFSFDNHDTWRDFVANTTGSIVAWALLVGYSAISKAKGVFTNR